MSTVLKGYTDNTSAPDDGSENITRTTSSTKELLDVALYDAAGSQITSFGGGTQYTEDAAAASDPEGNAQILVRADTPAGITTTDGDNVARRGTDYGAAFSQILDSSGNFIDSFGGGTQYTEGDTDASITGTAAMMEVAADTLQPVQGTVADGLLVNLGTNNDVTVSGVATAANQLPDGHNVTVDNASGASAVNIQDGGNSITVDGTITADAGTGTFTVTDDGSFTLAANSGVDIGDVDVLTLPDVTQATHDNLNANVNVQVGDADADTTNPVPTYGPNIEDSGNSSTTPLAGGATFTGTWTDTFPYQEISINVHSDVSIIQGGAGFIRVEWSNDGGTTVTETHDSDYVTVGGSLTTHLGGRIRYTPGWRYFRVSVKASFAMSVFALQTVLRRFNSANEYGLRGLAQPQFDDATASHFTDIRAMAIIDPTSNNLLPFSLAGDSLIVEQILTDITVAGEAYASLAFGAISGTYATLKNFSSNTAFLLQFINTLDEEVVVSLDAGTTDNILLPAGFSFLYDLAGQNRRLGGHIQVKHTGVAPTVGKIILNYMRS